MELEKGPVNPNAKLGKLGEVLLISLQIQGQELWTPAMGQS